MILKQFEYSEFINDEKLWAIKSFELGRINLFTAKNATGKTRTLKAMNWLSIMIKENFFNDHANYTVEFSDNFENYKYIVNNDDKKVVSEKLVGNTGTLLQRDNTGIGEMFTEQFDRNIEFQLPGKKLAISRRDLIQYPYLEKIHLWAESVQYYSFGTSMKQEYGKTLSGDDTSLYGKSDNSVEVFVVGELEFDNEFKKNVLTSMNNIGYDLNAIDVAHGLYSNPNVRSEDYTLFVSEKDRGAIVTQNAMSQGMFRALSIIIHLTYHAMMGIPTAILIDDIGEGLDFERSTKLIKLLIEIAEKNDHIQLIMSTNDRYVMNNVPFKYWQVIERKGGECEVHNYQNSKEKFDEFKYTGLNNFDFLATDFINAKREQK